MQLKTLKYSRQQIEEAIKFWTQILENKSPFLDRLVTEFGYDPVFRKDANMVFDLDSIKKIAYAANDIIFKRSIIDLRIVLDKHQKFTSVDVPFGYMYFIYDDEKSGKCTLLTQPVKDDEGNILFDSPEIYVSPEFLGTTKFNLITVSSIIVHEMIHQSIVENAGSEELSQIRDTLSAEFGHNDKFKQMMSDINSKFGLNISIQGSSTYDDDSFRSLQKFAGSDYIIPEDEKNNFKYASITNHEFGFTQIVLY